MIDTETSSAGTLETFVMGLASPLEDSTRVMANESVWRKCDGIDELSFRWRCLTGVSSTELRGGETGRGRSETKLLITRPPCETTGRLDTERIILTTPRPEVRRTPPVVQ